MNTNATRDERGASLEPVQEKYFAWMVLLVTAMTYLGTVRFDFVYDDYPQIIFNPFVKAWHYVPQYFVSSVWKQMSPFAPGNYYRPLFLLLLRVNYAMFANRPFGWHLVSLALHLLVTWQVYLVVKKMTGRLTPAWLSALIFGVHPVHHEVIAWISGATESLLAVMFLAAFLAYLRSREKAKPFWTAVACVFFVLALLSKETAIVFPVLVFAYEWIAGEPEEGKSDAGFMDRLKAALAASCIYLPFAIAYLIVRNRVLFGLGHSFASVSVTDWFLTLPSILLFYVRNWFVPVGLSGFYDLYYQHGLNFAKVLLPLLILITFSAAVWLARRRLGSRDVGFAAAWMVIPLLPALDTFVFHADMLVHDRYFYLPSIGAALLVALAIEHAAQTRPALFGQPLHVVVSGLALAVVLAVCATQTVVCWTDDYTLFTRAHQVAPLNGTVSNNLAAEMMSRQELAQAQQILETAFQAHPQDSQLSLNLGRLYYRKGDLPKAEEFIQGAVRLDSSLADTYVVLGQIRLKQNRRKEAQDSLRHAVDLNPYSAPYHTSYGIILALTGDCPDADRQFDAAISLSPGDGIAELQKHRCDVGPSATPPATVTKPGQL
jgi:protein O-mannosyl-transferase